MKTVYSIAVLFLFALIEKSFSQNGIFSPPTYTVSSCPVTHQWTTWFDTKDPSLQQGDFELTSHIQQLFPFYMCSTPLGVEVFLRFLLRIIEKR